MERLCGMSFIGLASIDLGTISCLVFLEKYMPRTLRHRKNDEFMAIKHDNITMATYEAKFHALPRFYTHLRKFDRLAGQDIGKYVKYVGTLRRNALVDWQLIKFSSRPEWWLQREEVMMSTWWAKRLEAAKPDAMITCTILVCDQMSNVLFDPDSTYSYVPMTFSLGLDLICDTLDAPIYVSTPVGELVLVTHVYRDCSMLFMGLQTWVDLVILDMLNFDVILESIPVVSKFPKVLPADLPDMHLNRGIDFCINLELGNCLISIPPYRIASVELREL
ncbi:hypothetical protein MTR67_022581 [Solanum verrucosum]|uniref:Uncharacterized protein n=1 Tax=Solanum verrucosum TaxID=315347 RepID=A0AAF0TQW4_SOLVR|nr:hypothetical protein MTR67_022581 [Solanum verrucosum]